MYKFIKYTLYTATLLAITFGVGIISYRLSDFTMDSTKTSAIGASNSDAIGASNTDAIGASNTDAIGAYNADTNVNDVKKVRKVNLEKSVPVLSKNAKFTFESDYSNKDSDIKTIEIPTVFIGASKDVIETSFSDWDVVEFSENSVYLKKIVETPEPMYVLTCEDGILVVYYKDIEGNVTVEEETSINVETLPEVDIEKIKQGIVYKNKTDVIMALQNYDS